MKVMTTLATIGIVSMLSTIGHGQEPSAKIISTPEGAIGAYSESTMLEKVFVHTDRATYLTGEYIWLKVYVVNAKDHQLLDVSKVAYVEVLDQENRAVVNLKVPMSNGTGHTAAFLPASLNSGNYTVRAYTRWMRNFSPEGFFHKVVTIINPFKPLNQPTAEAKEELYDIQFFPEGGDLVEGLTSRVAFRAVDDKGKGLRNIQGLVTGPRGDTVSRLTPLRFGLGDFTITPSGESAEVAFYDSTGKFIIRKSLPQARPDGVVMKVTDDQSDEVRVEVSQKNAIHSGLYLVVHTRLRNIQSVQGVADGNTTLFRLKKSAMADGVSHISLFDESGTALCERLYFKKPLQRMSIDGALTRKTFKAREKVTVTLNTTDQDTDPIDASLSLSVHMSDDLNPGIDIGITEYLLLTSDLRGRVESPWFYFTNDPMAKQMADLLMLTHGWRRFTWTEINTPVVAELVPEYRGHLVTGSITPRSPDIRVNNVPVYLSVPGRQFHLRGAKSDRGGNVLFELAEFYGPGRMIMQTDWTKDSLYTLALNNPFDTVFMNGFTPPDLWLNPSTRQSLLSRSINMQIDNAYLTEAKSKVIPAPWDSLSFYRIPDEQYFLDDFTRFGVMEEVMREYVPGVLVRKRQKSFYFLVLNDNNNTVFRNNSMVLLDGMPVFDVDQIMEYDPLKVERLDVITNRYHYGSLTFDGLVSYVTYSGDLPEFNVDKRALVTDYDGFSRQREFFSPVYETSEQKNSRIPDTRNLLFWQPEVFTADGNGSTITFFTCDVPGTYQVNVQGISRDGRPGQAILSFEVEEEED